jgi:hypothetical protein
LRLCPKLVKSTSLAPEILVGVVVIDPSTWIFALAYIDAVLELRIFFRPGEHIHPRIPKFVPVLSRLCVSRARTRNRDARPVRLENQAHSLRIAVRQEYPY